ncbi:MAG: hypothetical protein KAH86_03820 [Methanosarcinales archaeon]|nr:hypothetical protein [Methanosarcinales archaeon]
MQTLSDLINSDDAVSEVLGYILIFGMVVTMVGLIFTVAMPSIEDAQERAYIESIKRGITVLDSKASMVALGESPSQTISIDSKGGIFGVNESASYISIMMNGTGMPIFNGTLGTLTYELDDTVIAYEGGGVWMKYPQGDAIMLSPPEFHYNGETLTLPIIRLRGNEYTSGTGTVQFKVAKNSSEIRFPNAIINSSFVNPVAGSKDIQITITSDYYKAWAKYMDERTEVHGITTDDLNRQVSATLNIKPSNVAQELNDDIIVYDIDETVLDPITNFKLHLTASNLAAGLSPLNLDFKTSDSINPQLIINLFKSADFKITITYKNAGGPDEIWSTNTFAGGDITQEFDLLSNEQVTFKPSPASEKSESWGSNQYTYDFGDDFENGDTNTLSNITQHYLSIMPAPFEFTVDDKNTKVDLPNSNVTLNYAVAPPRLTYLHIVRHDIAVGVS